jgi:hypothetical protein
MLAGFTGTVPNYLCYVNTVLFYRVGGGSRLSGVLLAAATGGVMLIGPSVIGYLRESLSVPLFPSIGSDNLCLFLFQPSWSSCVHLLLPSPSKPGPIADQLPFRLLQGALIFVLGLDLVKEARRPNWHHLVFRVLFLTLSHFFCSLLRPSGTPETRSRTTNTLSSSPSYSVSSPRPFTFAPFSRSLTLSFLLQE